MNKGINVVREELHTLIRKGYDLTDDNVVTLSQQLDVLIVQEQKRRLRDME